MAPESPKPTLLIVDDEPDVREVLEEYLATQGYNVVGAESAAAARAAAAKQPFDLVLLDIHLPGEDGLSLARHLRERYAKIAIIMIVRVAEEMQLTCIKIERPVSTASLRDRS